MESGWVESSIRGTSINNVFIDQANRLVGGVSGKDCLLFDSQTGDCISVVHQDEEIVGAFFTSSDELVTVSSEGEACQWRLGRGQDDPSISASHSIKGKVIHVRLEAGEMVALMEEKRDRLLVSINSSWCVERMAVVPPETDPSSFSVSTQLLAVCNGKSLRVTARSADAKVRESVAENVVNVEGLGERNKLIRYERVHVRGDTVAASITTGRIFIWTEVSRLGVGRTTQSVHWHKSSPSFLLSSLGGLLSAGGECVLCKWTLGKGAPTMLPRLSAPVRMMSLSDNSSFLVLLLDDNKVLVVDVAGMSVQCSMSTISAATRNDCTSLLLRDPLNTESVVVEGREGTLQWLHPSSSSAAHLIDISLENTLDRDIPLYGVVQTFHRIRAAAMSKEHAVTVEESSVEEKACRVRVWNRRSHRLNLAYSQEVQYRLFAVSTLTSTANRPIFILTDVDGRSFVLDKSSSGWHLDPSKTYSWYSKPARACSAVSEDLLWAVAFPATPTKDVVVILNIDNMREVEVLSVEGEVKRLEMDCNLLVASTTKGVYCFSACSFTLQWKVDESWTVRLSPVPVAWNKRNVVVVDGQSGDTIHSLSSSLPVLDALAFWQDDQHAVFLRRSDNSWSVLSPSPLPRPHRRRRVSSMRMSISDATPSLPSTVSLVPPPPPSAPTVQSLSGPAHMLPSVALLAPSFLRSCLVSRSE